jgi:hypothetical protein
MRSLPATWAVHASLQGKGVTERMGDEDAVRFDLKKRVAVPDGGLAIPEQRSRG